MRSGHGDPTEKAAGGSARGGDGGGEPQAWRVAGPDCSREGPGGASVRKTAGQKGVLDVGAQRGSSP